MANRQLTREERERLKALVHEKQKRSYRLDRRREQREEENVDLKEIRKQLTERGYRIGDQLKNGHFPIYTPTGQRLRQADSNLPLDLPNSPHADSAESENQLAMLRRVGINLKEPVKNGSDSRQAGAQAYRDARAAKSDELRIRLKRIMTADPQMKQSHVYRFADALARKNSYRAPKNGQTAISGFLKGGAFEEDAYNWMLKAVQAIESNGNQIPVMSTVVPEPPVPTPEELRERLAAREPKESAIPELALELSRHIYSPDKDHDRINEILRRVARWELDDK